MTVLVSVGRRTQEFELGPFLGIAAFYKIGKNKSIFLSLSLKELRLG